MDAHAFRSQFPVLHRIAYLNAGTDGPMPRMAAEAARAEITAELEEGRAYAHFERRLELQDALRERYSAVLGADPAEVAVTSGTTAGLGAVLAGLDLGPGDEIVTSHSEHPGLIGPLIAARARGVTVRAVPLADVADAVRPTTTLVACSHVSWHSGEYAPAALAEVPVPVVLDGAQAAGAVPVDVKALGCAAYAAAGQKWMCGADGTGMLYLEPDFASRVRTMTPSYMSFEEPSRGFDSPLRAEASRLDTPALPREAVALSLAAADLLAHTGAEAVIARATGLATQLAEALAGSGRSVVLRGDTTLVAWQDPDPEASMARLAEAGVIIRNLPGTPYLRASVGAWNDESDLDRLLGSLA